MNKQKLEVKFFKLFQVLHFISKKNYKIKLFKKCKTYNFFYILLLE